MTETDFVAQIHSLAERLHGSVAQMVVGKAHQVDLMLAAVLCRGHVLVDDVPGIGKTTLAKAFAGSLGLSFRRIQFTPDLMPSDVTGVNIFDQRNGEFSFRPGPIFTQVLLGDELNRATPRTQSALLEAMQEGQVTVEGETRPLPRPFLVLATQNPIELEGTFPLPEAQLDRFLLRVRLGYPTAEEEQEILQRSPTGEIPEGFKPVIGSEELERLADRVGQVRIEEALQRYLVEMARATRRHPGLELGVSPRGTLSLHRVAQAWAAIQGREYVLPDDVKALLPAAWAHRVIPTPQTRLRGRAVEEVLAEVVEQVPVPVDQGSALDPHSPDVESSQR